MAALYGVELPENVVMSLVQAWRKANSNIASLWWDLDNAVRKTINTRSETICRKIRVTYQGGWLRLHTPSGRSLCYPSPRIVDEKITFMGTNPYTRNFERMQTYGGRLVENLSQSIARDVLVNGMFLAEQAGYNIVLSVHDELKP